MRLGHRALVLLSLLSCLFWQQLVLPLLPTHLGRQAAAAEHVWVHADEVRHHHHAEGDLHLEDGPGTPAPHVHLDTGSLSQWAVLIPHPLPPCLPGGSAPIAGIDLFRPGPVLDGPLRPPRPLV